MEEARDRLSREKEEWERRTDPEPPAPHHRAAERHTRAGAPFYRLVDFAEGLSPAQQAGLEAALEASGVLDAWVTADGVLLDPLTRDTVLQPGATTASAGPTLADALRPAAHPDSGVTAGRVERLLSAIALVSPEEDAVASAIYYDGSWRLGVARGRHTKSGAEYVGAAVRAETRRRKLAELDVHLAELGRRLTDGRDRLADVESSRRSLGRAERDFPRSRRLAEAWARAESDESRMRDLTGKAARAARRAEEARADAVAARGEAEATATARDLPTGSDDLDRVRTALTGLLSGIEHLHRATRGAIAEMGTHQTHLDRYGRARDSRSRAEEEYRIRLDALRGARQDLRTREEALGSSAEELLAREERTQQRITSAVAAIPQAERARDELHDHRVRAEEEEKQCREELLRQEQVVIAAGASLRRALGRPEVLRGAGLDQAVFTIDLPDQSEADARSRIRALRTLADAVREKLDRPRDDVSDSALLKRHTDLRDQLAGGYDAQLEELDGIKVCRLIDDHGSHDVALVGERIADQATEARGRLTSRESEVFQRFLTGELGDHLSAQVIAAANLVAALNDTLRSVRTSHGLGVELQWKLDDDVGADVREAVELLRSPSGLRTREQTEKLREVLQRRIEDARRADPAAGYAAHLRTALDYRAWFRFHTFVVDDAAPGRRRRLTGRTGLSQGEQRVLSYLVLFAAAAAHFTTLGEATPHAPRLILLDDAFAKVDEPTHGRLGRILVDLDLDFVLTSERLMGNSH